MALLISRATTKTAGSVEAKVELTVYCCTVRNDVFCVRAKNVGQVWLVIMDRYKVEHPSQIPQPCRVAPVAMTISGELNPKSVDGVVEHVIDDNKVTKRMPNQSMLDNRSASR